MKAWMRLPLIDVRIEFLFNILKTNRPIKTKFCKHIIIDKIYFGIVNRCFFSNWQQSYGPLLRQNLVFAQYLENELTK